MGRGGYGYEFYLMLEAGQPPCAQDRVQQPVDGMEDILLQTLCRQLLPFLQVELLFSLLWVKILI